ncbi:MAG: HAD family hydrolase [Chloroflexota bacterium]|nr:HAD family hydrolase [Chloroflexota bacterium]
MARPFDLITFDFDGVLLHNNYQDLFLEQCRALGLSWPDDRERHLARFVHDYYGSGQSRADWEAHGEEGFWTVANQRFLDVLRAEGDLEAALAALRERMQELEIIYLYEHGIHELLDSLREEGYRLAMLTNRDENILEFGVEWGMIEPFEFIGTRETVGKPKPEPDVYHHIADRFGVSADRALHVGDNPYADILGAHAAGWDAILIDPDDLFLDWDVPRIPTIHDLPEWLASRSR